MLELMENIRWNRLIISFLIIAGSVTAWFLLKKLFRRWNNGEKARGSKKSFAPVLWTIARAIIILLTGIVVLEVNGVNVSAAITGLGIASAMVALAVQDILKDVIMGIHILSDRFFKVGDPVILNGDLGIVEDFSLKTTKIRRLEAPGIRSVCNRNIEDIIVPGDMIILRPSLSYGEDQKTVDRVLTAAAQKIAALDGVKDCRYMGIGAFADSAISHRIFIYAPIEDCYAITRAANRIVLDELTAAGIQIPFPQMDVHVKDVPQTPAG